MIGLLFGMPAGAVGAMTAQRTLNYGMKAGLLTGLGSSAADCIYACIGVFGLTLISDFLMKYQGILNLAGGGLILWMGIRLLRTKNGKVKNTADFTGGIRMFFTSFAVGGNKSGSRPYLPVRIFLVWNYRKNRGCGRHMSCLRCIYRYLYLVGDAFRDGHAA